MVREIAGREVVEVERKKGVKKFTIAVSRLKSQLAEQGFPSNHTPQICNALRSNKFLNEYQLELEKTEGPPSLTSTTVVFHYRFKGTPSSHGHNRQPGESATASSDGFLRLKGLLKDVFQELGGGEKFLSELRRDPEEGIRP